jgi:hypothetical protein
MPFNARSNAIAIDLAPGAHDRMFWRAARPKSDFIETSVFTVNAPNWISKVSGFIGRAGFGAPSRIGQLRGWLSDHFRC